MHTLQFTESPLTRAVRHGIWAALALPGWALGAPTGGEVVAGSAAIAQQGSTTTITQTTARSAIDWQGFSIAGHEYVQFVQPSSQAVTLNRVVGNDPSQLLGRLSANGQVFLINPSGVYFGPNARIDVAGLVATTFDLSNDDFMAGRYQFSRVAGRAPAQVVNDGTLTADGGYVVLAGDGVVNHGLIEAYLGDIVLAAGERISLDLGGDGLISFAVDGASLTELAGVSNTGELYADGGRVFLTARVQDDLLATAVNHEGLIRARTVEERGGVVYLGGAGGDITVAGSIDADATTANGDGGTILVRSDRDITVSDGALLTAQGSGSGAGGMVRLVASEVLDVAAGATVTTVGGAAGQGGFIEVSGHASLQLRGDVDPGVGGSLLIDPASIEIRGGSCPTGCSEDSFTSGGLSVVYEETLEGYLNSDINVALIASNDILATDLTNGLDASGTGNLTLGIGSIVSSGSGLEFPDPLFGAGGAFVDCGSGGVCTSLFGSDGPWFFDYDPNVVGTIHLFDGAGDPAGIDINGSVRVLAGIPGEVVIGSVTGSDIRIDGRITHTVDTSAAHTFALTALGGDVRINGQLEVDNLGGPLDIDIVGNSIVVNGSLLAGQQFSVPGVAAPTSVTVDALTGSAIIGGGVLVTSRNADATIDIRGQGVNLNVTTARSLGGSGSASITVDGKTGSVTAGKLTASAVQGDAGVKITGNGISVASALAFAGGGNDAKIDLNAGNGAFLWNGSHMAAFDFLPSGNCSYGGSTCFTPDIGATGLEFPTYPQESGSATINIQGASVTLRSPFASQPANLLGATGFVGAVGGAGAFVDVTATNGNLVIGSGSLNLPLVFAQAGTVGTGDASLRLTATNGEIVIDKALTPVIHEGIARDLTLLALAHGDKDAEVLLTGGDITFVNGATALAAADMFGSTLGTGVTARIDVTGDTLALDGNFTSIVSNGVGATQTLIALEAGTGDLLLNGAVTTQNLAQPGAAQRVLLEANGNVILDGATIDSGLVAINALTGSLQGINGTTIDGQALSFRAGTTIDLGGAALTGHNGTPDLPAYQFGDATMLSEFALLGGTVPGSTLANAAFIAPDGVTLGSFDFFGDYLYLKSDTLKLNQPIDTWLPGSEGAPVVNPNVIVQLLPFTASQAIAIEDVLPSPVAGTTYYGNSSHFQRFPGTSLFVGGSLFGGPVTIGQNGTINIGGQNFLVATGGAVNGLGNIVSTGLVGIVGGLGSSPSTTPGTFSTVVQQTVSDPTGSTIDPDWVDSQLTEEGEATTDTTLSEEPLDLIAMLEQQPLVDAELEVNNTVLTCR
jgi:filamentous hemagglutinin family protein